MFLYQLNILEESYNANDDEFKKLNNIDEVNKADRINMNKTDEVILSVDSNKGGKILSFKKEKKGILLKYVIFFLIILLTL